MTSNYYVVERRYTGVNAGQVGATNVVEIRRDPGVTANMGTPVVDGELGVYHDWWGYAYGGFATEREARDHVQRLWGDATSEMPDVAEGYDLAAYYVVDEQMMLEREGGDTAVAI